MLAALSVTTKQGRLVATQTTTYNEPYHLARKFASLDHLSNGRVGWNLVISYVPAEAHNFSRSTHAGNTDRYARAEEFHRVAVGLWDSWDDDAFLLDKETGRYFDPAKLHVLNHEGGEIVLSPHALLNRVVAALTTNIELGTGDVSGPGGRQSACEGYTSFRTCP